ncbi:hypothetical protein AgCh_005204 [Apium graveolens]
MGLAVGASQTVLEFAFFLFDSKILDKEAVEEVKAQREISEIKPSYIIQLKVPYQKPRDHGHHSQVRVPYERVSTYKSDPESGRAAIYGVVSILISVIDDQQMMSLELVTSVDIRREEGKQEFKAVKDFISEALY